LASEIARSLTFGLLPLGYMKSLVYPVKSNSRAEFLNQIIGSCAHIKIIMTRWSGLLPQLHEGLNWGWHVNNVTENAS
jgi:hypothetical protein